MSRSTNMSMQQTKIGVALGGGGPVGGIYTMGALRAIDEAFDGLNFNNLHAYVGVSAGAFLAANLANQMTTAQMCRVFIKKETGEHPFHPEMLIKPAFKEFARRGRQVPKRLFETVMRFLSNPKDQSLLEALTTLAKLLPAGVFDNTAVDTYLEKIYSSQGRTNSFTELHRHLFLIAADIDRAETVLFGAKGYDHVSISKAVQASIAAPGLYMPVEIDGRYYVDGTLRKSLHSSVAFEKGADLVIGVNPLVPLDTNLAIKSGSIGIGGRITDGGLPDVLAQTTRAMNYSRLKVGIDRCKQDYPDGDLLLIQPARHDAKMFFANVYSYESRFMICEHAYQMTRMSLLKREKEIAPVLKKHGITLNLRVLKDESRSFTSGLYGNVVPISQLAAAKHIPVTERLNRALDSLNTWISKP